MTAEMSFMLDFRHRLAGSRLSLRVFFLGFENQVGTPDPALQL